jgi:rRNA maturation protein Nop10
VSLPPWHVSGPLTAADAASNLGVNLRVVRRALRRGYLQGEKVGNAWVIPEGTLAQRGRLEASRVGVWLALSEASVARFAERRRPVEEDPASGEIRTLILDGTCPWCGRTNLQVPARHVTSRHGVDRRELRRLMGVRARTPICAPEQTERRRQRTLRPERLAQLRTLTG